MHSLSATLQVLCTRFTSIAWSTTSESTFFSLPELAWSLWFLKPMWNFLNHLVTVINGVFTFYTTNVFGYRCSIMVQFELVKYVPKLDNVACFICVNFKSHKEWNNVQYVSAPTSMMLPITVSIYHSLNCFSHVIYVQETSTYFQNIAKLLTHTSTSIIFPTKLKKKRTKNMKSLESNPQPEYAAHSFIGWCLYQ